MFIVNNIIFKVTENLITLFKINNIEERKIDGYIPGNNYFFRFLKAYAKEGIPIWGVTGQNEPTDGFFTNFSFQAMGWTPEMQRDFIVKDLGPALQQNSLGHVKIMILDDSRLQLPYWAEQVDLY